MNIENTPQAQRILFKDKYVFAFLDQSQSLVYVLVKPAFLFTIINKELEKVVLHVFFREKNNNCAC